MTQLQILAHAGTTQVQVAVLHPQVIPAICLIFDGEGRRNSRIEDIQFGNNQFDIARRQMRVLARALAHRARYLYHIFAPQLIRLFAEFSIILLIENKLGDAVAVAQIYERHSTHLARLLNPPGQGYNKPFIGQPQVSTSSCSIH